MAALSISGSEGLQCFHPSATAVIFRMGSYSKLLCEPSAKVSYC